MQQEDDKTKNHPTEQKNITQQHHSLGQHSHNYGSAVWNCWRSSCSFLAAQGYQPITSHPYYGLNIVRKSIQKPAELHPISLYANKLLECLILQMVRNDELLELTRITSDHPHRKRLPRKEGDKYWGLGLNSSIKWHLTPRYLVEAAEMWFSAFIWICLFLFKF